MKNPLILTLAAAFLTVGFATEAEARPKHRGKHVVKKKIVHRHYNYPRYHKYHKPKTHKNEAWNVFLTPGGGLGFSYHENRYKAPRYPHRYYW